MNHVLNDMSVSIDAPVQAYVWWDILSPQPWLKCCSDGAECSAMFTEDNNIKNGVCLRWQETKLLIPLSGLQIFRGQYWNPSTNHGQYQEWPVHVSPHPTAFTWKSSEKAQNLHKRWGPPVRFINPYPPKKALEWNKANVRQLSNLGGLAGLKIQLSQWWIRVRWLMSAGLLFGSRRCQLW